MKLDMMENAPEGNSRAAATMGASPCSLTNTSIIGIWLHVHQAYPYIESKIHMVKLRAFQVAGGIRASSAGMRASQMKNVGKSTTEMTRGAMNLASDQP